MNKQNKSYKKFDNSYTKFDNSYKGFDNALLLDLNYPLCNEGITQKHEGNALIDNMWDKQFYVTYFYCTKCHLSTEPRVDLTGYKDKNELDYKSKLDVVGLLHKLS